MTYKRLQSDSKIHTEDANLTIVANDALDQIAKQWLQENENRTISKGEYDDLVRKCETAQLEAIKKRLGGERKHGNHM